MDLECNNQDCEQICDAKECNLNCSGKKCTQRCREKGQVCNMCCNANVCTQTCDGKCNITKCSDSHSVTSYSYPSDFVTSIGASTTRLFVTKISTERGTEAYSK